MELEKLKSENAQLQKDLKYQTDQKFEYFLENIKLEKERNDYNQQRDSLIKDVEKLRGELKDMEDDYAMVNGNCMYWEDKFHEIDKKYNKLTEHIKDKALNNPSEHRYFRLVHFIDDLEADTHD